MLGIDYDSSEGSSGEEVMIGKKPKGKKMRNKEQAWMGEFAEEEEGTWGLGAGKKKNQKKPKNDGPMVFVKAPAKTPETDGKKQEENNKASDQPTLPPMTKPKYSISMASPKKPEPDQKPTVSAKSQKDALGFLGDVSKGKNKVILNMMKKMGGGWRPGEGMGKNKQGISEAITVKVRPKMMGIGGIDEKTDQQRRKEKRDNGEPEEEEVVEVVKKQTLHEELKNLSLSKKEVVREGWKKKKPKKAKMSDATPLSFGETDLVDMTKNYAVYDDRKGAYLRDLRGGLSRVVADAEDQARQVDFNITAEKEKLGAIEAQKRDGEDTHVKQIESINSLEQALKVLSKLQDKIDEETHLKKPKNKITSIALITAVSRLVAEYPIVFSMMQNELFSLIVSLGLPILQSEISRWDPSTDPTLPIPSLLAWKNLLGHTTALYKQFAWSILGDPLKVYFNARWSPSDPTSAVDMYRAYEDVLPKSCREHLLHCSVIPRMLQFVEMFTGGDGEAPLHEIVTPWVEICTAATLSDKGVFSAVKAKLVYLAKPNVSIATVCHAITPWKDVFSNKLYSEVRVRYGVRRVTEWFEGVVLIGNKEGLPAGVAPVVAEWCKTEGGKTLESVLQIVEGSFLPRLGYVLAKFLKETKDVKTGVMWLRFWRNELRGFDEYLPDTHWRTLYNLALVGKQYVESHTGDSIEFDAEAACQEAARILKATPSPSPTPVVPSFDDHHMSLRDHVTHLAADANLPFHPTKSSTSNGKQTYKLGSLSVYFESECLYVEREKGGWAPAPSIMEAISKAAMTPSKKMRPNEEDTAAADDVDLD